VIHKEVSPACQQSSEKTHPLSCRLDAGVFEKHVVENEQDSTTEAALSADSSKNVCQSVKPTSPEIVDSRGKLEKDISVPEVRVEQKPDTLLSTEFCVQKKDDRLSLKSDYKKSNSVMPSSSSETKASKSKTGYSHRRHRSLSDGDGSRRHQHHHRHRHGHKHHEKAGSEQTSRNAEQLVPPLKIRVEHHSKCVDQQSAVAATYSVNASCADNAVDPVGVVMKTSDPQCSKAVMSSISVVADVKTEKDNVLPVGSAVSSKAETDVTTDQRRTRSAGAAKPVPQITKRRLTFEESLIAGTCISTTSGPVVGTDSVKVSTTMQSGSCSENYTKESVQSTAKPLADTKSTLPLKTSENREIVPSLPKKVKLEDIGSASAPHLSSRNKAPEVKMNEKSSDTTSGESNLKESLSHSVSLRKEPENKSAAIHHDVTCDSKTDSVSDDSFKLIKSGNGLVSSSNVPSTKKDAAESAVISAEEPASNSTSQLSDRTSHHHHRHHHRDHHFRHLDSSSRPHRMTGSELDYELKRSRHGGGKYSSLMHVETQPNGGASVLHAYDDELSALTPRELSEFVREFFRIVFDEEPVGVPHYVMGIVHNSATYLPDILEYFASAHPDMVVKRSHLGKSSDLETTTMSEYFKLVQSTYLAGTYRTGPLDHFSIVGTKAEETGGYFPEFLDLLDQNEFLKCVLPWGRMSELENLPRNESNDGPIVWARPGEQVVPTADMPKSPQVKKR